MHSLDLESLNSSLSNANVNSKYEDNDWAKI